MTLLKDVLEMLVPKQVDWSGNDHLSGLSKMDLPNPRLDLVTSVAIWEGTSFSRDYMKEGSYLVETQEEEDLQLD